MTIDNDTILSERIKVGELDIHYLSGGTGDPLIIIHGGGDGSRSWEKTAEAIAGHYHIYAPDLPGFGLSQSMSDEFHIAQYVEFIDNFSIALGLKRFHVIGHSIGGGIALHYALKHPAKVIKLVLVSSWCIGKEVAFWVRFFSQSLFCNTLGRLLVSTITAVKKLAALFSNPLICVSPLIPVQIDMGRTLVTLKGQTVVLLHRLSELAMPTLLIWGGRDVIVPAKQAFAAAQLIPDCQVHIFKECGHSVYKQNINGFSRILAGFLRK